MNILITGSSGFIAKHFINKFILDKKINIYGIDILDNDSKDNYLYNFIKWDIKKSIPYEKFPKKN